MGHTISPVRCARRWTVHPHIRGAYIDRVGGGNSPRRFIPTYVGHTRTIFPLAMVASVHPHIRGAYGCIRLADKENLRFIPTYVGHTSRCQKKKAEKPVHPHIRGAYILLIGDCAVQDGSSPHTWGIQALSANGLRYVRFIPTYVGHTRPCFMYPQWGAVHPHIRGAYTICPIYLFYYIGSSPHTWGIRYGYWEETSDFGSSPHTWGIPASAPGGNVAVRFIPTYVGHTVAPAHGDE